ncbi:hypothetical protein [Nocardia arthritidis]|uniref:Uncharacterized protein n=1 Tax=Nocardia arthritidis TaxID=228602 RepID=A0A6G9Y900_9NOCA|nr:hypothetical protein [Nocardia arthritidis]QIS09699.1 hypothetical protein F5544_08990 [Nocardia arthritidis]
MEALLELSPRFVSSDTVETDIEFSGPYDLHRANACRESAYCVYGTDACFGTA